MRDEPANEFQSDNETPRSSLRFFGGGISSIARTLDGSTSTPPFADNKAEVRQIDRKHISLDSS